MLVAGAWMPDGAHLSVIIGTDRNVFAIMRKVDGTYEGDGTDWHKISPKAFATALPEVTALGTTALITVLTAADPPVNTPDFWLPQRCVYTHSDKPFAQRFGAFKPIGTKDSRVRPTIPPLP